MWISSINVHIKNDSMLYGVQLSYNAYQHDFIKKIILLYNIFFSKFVYAEILLGCTG